MSPTLSELQAFVDARRAAGEGYALLLVDSGVVGELDAGWGYAVGDAAQEFLASRLRTEAMREQDLLVAAGRGEFACALAAVDEPGVAVLAAEKVLRALDTPLWVGEEEIHARGAVGIALPTGGVTDVAALLGHAKCACRRAQSRTGRIAVFTAGDADDAVARLGAQSQLRAAVVSESAGFLFRPQRDVRSGMLLGAQGGIAWAGGVASVGEAIAAVRAARRVHEATRWLVGAALRHCTELRQGCGLDLRVSLSLSVRDLQQADLADSIRSMMSVWNLRPSRLTIGILDAGVLLERAEARGLLQALGGAGLRLALEDPDAGLAVLAQLDALPFAELRLDQSRLGGLAGSPKRQANVKAIVEMAHQLRLEVLADGVADAEAAQCLVDLGCDVLQGEHVGPFASVRDFIAAHQQ